MASLFKLIIPKKKKKFTNIYQFDLFQYGFQYFHGENIIERNLLKFRQREIFLSSTIICRGEREV